jgi:hypothetical protein
MATTNYLLTKGQNSSGESQIILRTYVRHDFRLRIQSGIRINPKRWGKKNGITIPTISGDEQEDLLRKKELLKRFTAWIEDEIKKVEDKESIDSKWGDKMVRRFYKPAKAAKEREKSFFDVIEVYLHVRHRKFANQNDGWRGQCPRHMGQPTNRGVGCGRSDATINSNKTN